MQRFRDRLFLLVGLLGLAGSAWGFSFQGPYAPWQTPRLGYDAPGNISPNAHYGGPMAITEEYRWNVPEVYYGFTPEFAQYFGERGMDEIQKVFTLLNSLPDASRLDIDDYPRRSLRNNFQAGALGLRDLRSVTMSMALEMMGLADPTRYVYTLRARWTTSNPDTTNFFTIRRNYDPDTWRTSPFVNGVLYTYTAILDGDTSFVLTEPVDPLVFGGAMYAPVTAYQRFLSLGGYWTTLTRDDAAALNYIYRKDNYNIETMGGSVTYVSGGAWGAPPGGTNVVGVTNFVNTALRPGRDKIRFRRVNYDSLFGYFEPITNRFEDKFITNGVVLKQNLERALVLPDIVFHAGDTLGGDGFDGAQGFIYTFQPWTYGNTNTAAGGTNLVTGFNFGPGTIDGGVGGPSFTITFNTTDEIWYNIYPLDSMDELGAARLSMWGSFDGTTNAPVVYPVGVEVRDVEALVLRGRTDDPWGAPPASLIATNTIQTGVGTITP